MRRPFVAGNWKMNLNRQRCVELAEGLSAGAAAGLAAEIAVCPPAVYLDAVRQAIGDAPVGLAAQNVYFEDNGAYTGEISTQMLTDVGCQYVVLGHSERRHILGETDVDVAKKVSAALAAGIKPIVCVGETLEEREADRTTEVVSSQFRGSVGHLSDADFEQVVIAYEPVWAIGTGKVATPQQAEAVHADLRKLIETSYNADLASKVRIQYGGSVKPENAVELLGQPNIDGALVGGASLEVESFLAIASAAPIAG
jgi:triosephosphate isomerase